MLEFTSHRGEPTLVDPSEIVAVRQSGGQYEGSAIIVLRHTPDRFGHDSRCPEIFVKESSAEVVTKLRAEPKPVVVGVEYAIASDATRPLGQIVSDLVGKGWTVDGPVTTAEKFKSDEDIRRHGKTTLYIQRLVKYA